MITTKTTWKTKKSQVSRKGSKKESVSEVVVEKKVSDNSDANVSVFTKTTSPKVVVQAEKMESFEFNQNIYRHKILLYACLIIMGIIILMTFFLALKTYNNVNELSDYIHLIIHP